MTESQINRKAAEDAQASIFRLENQLANVKQELRFAIELRDYFQKEYARARREEIESRRNFVPEPPRSTIKNHGPAAEWKVWRAHLDRVTSHPKYSSPLFGNDKALLLKLARFCSNMLAVTNTATWNVRNPAPYLP